MTVTIRTDERSRAALGAISLEIVEKTLDDLWERLAPNAVKPEVLEISLAAVDPEEMRELNGKYRGIDEPTDVLSFPLWETDEGGFVPPSAWPEIGLGDIVVCPGKVADNAAAYGKTYEDELLWVLVHGVLHLFALDHATEKDKARMWKIQEDLVKAYAGRKKSAPKEEE